MILFWLMWRVIAAERTLDNTGFGPDEVAALLRTLARRAWKLLKVASKAALVIVILCAMFNAAPALMTVACGALALVWLMRKK